MKNGSAVITVRVTADDPVDDVRAAVLEKYINADQNIVNGLSEMVEERLNQLTAEEVSHMLFGDQN